jgi:hypothetical protein
MTGGTKGGAQRARTLKRLGATGCSPVTVTLNLPHLTSSDVSVKVYYRTRRHIPRNCLHASADELPCYTVDLK